MIGRVRSVMQTREDGRLNCSFRETCCPVCEQWRPAKSITIYGWACSPTCEVLLKLAGGIDDFQVELTEESKDATIRDWGNERLGRDEG